MSVGSIFGILGGAGATASAVAAAWSAKAAGSAFRPFVIAASPPTAIPRTVEVITILSNAGPGPALDVRWQATGTDWSPTLLSLQPGVSLNWRTTDQSLTERWKVTRAPDKINAAFRSVTITIEFSALDGTRWRIVQRGSGGRPELQRLTPRLFFFWRRIDGSASSIA
jgi:hypothetical protein